MGLVRLAHAIVEGRVRRTESWEEDLGIGRLIGDMGLCEESRRFWEGRVEVYKEEVGDGNTHGIEEVDMEDIPTVTF